MIGKTNDDGDDDGDPKLTDCLLSAVSATACGSILPKCVWCKEPIAGLCVTESAARKMNLMPFFTCSLKDDVDDGNGGGGGGDGSDDGGGGDDGDAEDEGERAVDEGEKEEVDEEQSSGEYEEVELGVNSLEYGDMNEFAENIFGMEQD